MRDGPQAGVFIVFAPWSNPPGAREMHISFDADDAVVTIIVYRRGQLSPERVHTSPPCHTTYDFFRDVTRALAGRHVSGE